LFWTSNFLFFHNQKRIELFLTDIKAIWIFKVALLTFKQFHRNFTNSFFANVLQTVTNSKCQQKAALKLLVKLTLGVNFTIPLAQSRNVTAVIVWSNQFHQQNCAQLHHQIQIVVEPNFSALRSTQ